MIIKLKNRYMRPGSPNNYRHNHILSGIKGNEPNCYGAPTIMLQGQLICVEQLFDKQLFAAKAIKVYNHPYAGNTVVFTVQKNKVIGTCISYLSTGGNVWLMVQPGPPMQAVWVKVENNAFSLEALQEQGGATFEDIEEQNQSWWESITDSAGNIINDTVSPTKTLIKWGVPLFVGYIVYNDFIKPRQGRR